MILFIYFYLIIYSQSRLYVNIWLRGHLGGGRGAVSDSATSPTSFIDIF